MTSTRKTSAQPAVTAAAVEVPVAAEVKKPKKAAAAKTAQQSAPAAVADAVEKPVRAAKPAVAKSVDAPTVEAASIEAPQVEAAPAAEPAPQASRPAFAERIANLRAARPVDTLAAELGHSAAARGASPSVGDRVRTAANAVGGFAGTAASLVRNPSAEKAGEVLGAGAKSAAAFVVDHKVAAAAAVGVFVAPGTALLTGLAGLGLAGYNIIDQGSVSAGIEKTGEQVGGAVRTAREEAGKTAGVVAGWFKK